ncbi:MAG: alpha-mannosidase [Ruminococcaceae bacterium]|nr:alpha-mannosidase [Oscillospiraceae bacterium]
MNEIHIIGNAHIDPVWLWEWQEGFAEIKATFKSALDRMREFDDFKFTSACGAYYMWIEKSDPAMFAEIQERVKEGRWCITGGWFIQPDCNIPCGESFARHALITQRYFLEKFGKMAITGYNVDSFGHNGNLPQILNQSRMKNYVFMRPAKHEKELPQNLFVWESQDGSKVNTYRIPFYYNIDGVRRPMFLFDDIASIYEGTDQMAFYGVGNHGGGPTVELLNEMHRTLSERFVYSDPDSFFESQDMEKAPIVQDDLQFHAKGCYSANSEIKKNNRYAENKLLSAEKMSALAQKLVGERYPQTEINYAWERILFNQFHDILCGCSIREAFDDARAVHGEAMAIADRLTNFACQQISWRIDTLCGEEDNDYVPTEMADRIGTPIVIFNPSAHKRKEIVRIRDPHSRIIYNKITDGNGNEVAIQMVRDSKTDKHKKYARIFEAEVEPFGYTVYRMFNTPEIKETENLFTFEENSMSNSVIKVTFDTESGEISSIKDILKNKELLSSQSELALYDDEKNDTWAHGTVFFKDRVETCVKGSVRVTERGPVRAAVRSEQSFFNSTLIRDYYIYPDSDVIDVNVKIDFHEKFRVLKFLYPTATEDAKAYCKIPFGYIERATDGAEQVCGDWIAIKDDKCGLCIASDSKHSFEADKNTLSLTVLRSALFADHYGERDEFCEFMEQGEHFFKYRIFPFDSFSHAECRALELQTPFITVNETFHKGALPTAFSGISVSAENITVTAIKVQEDGKGTVVRLYESEGRDTDAKIKLFGTEFDICIPHNSTKTYIVDESGVKETDFIELDDAAMSR